MPELTLMLHELETRHGEIPDVNDCYLVDIRDGDGRGPMVARHDLPKDYDEDNDPGIWPCPAFGQNFDALLVARHERSSFKYQWGGHHEHVRIGNNTPAVRTPVTLTFRWGEGHPRSSDGITLLLHEGTRHGYCKWCRCEMSAYPRDCAVRRLNVLADAVRGQQRPTTEDFSGRIDECLRAVEKWHRPKS